MDMYILMYLRFDFGDGVVRFPETSPKKQHGEKIKEREPIPVSIGRPVRFLVSAQRTVVWNKQE